MGATFMKTFVAKLLVPVAALTLVTGLSADSVVEEIVARVNDQIITRSELQHGIEEARKELSQQNAPQAAITQKEKDALRDLIDQQLMIQKANDLGISADAEVIKRLDQMRKEMNLETMEDLEKAATQQGVSFEDYKLQMKNSILSQRVIGEEVGRRISVSPEDIEKFYNEHKQEFNQPEQVALSEILISTDKSAKNPSDDEGERTTVAEAKAKSVYEKLKSGAKWDDLVKANSDGETAAQGGQLGLYKRGQLAKELEDKVFPLKTGEYSEPIHTRQGFLILKADRHIPAGVPPLKDVQNEVQNALYYERLQPALRQYLTKLREDAFIEVRAGFVDTGASPNQTKPIYTTATADPNAKKLTKKKKKLGIF
jgi:peptidyl-prolyl cis-trans isomerase SurA